MAREKERKGRLEKGEGKQDRATVLLRWLS